MMELVSLIRMRPETLLSHYHNSKKMAIYRPAIISSPELDYADTLMSDFPAPSTVRNKTSVV